MKSVTIHAENLTATSFRQFGKVIEANTDPVLFHNPNRMHNLAFNVDGSAALYLIRYQKERFATDRFERHFTMTEARVSLMGPSILLVAGDPATDKANKLPDPSTVKAFVIKSQQGLIFNKGAWHSLGCLPLQSEYVDFLFITECEAERELLEVREAELSRTQIRNYADDYQMQIEVAFGGLRPN